MLDPVKLPESSEEDPNDPYKEGNYQLCRADGPNLIVQTPGQTPADWPADRFQQFEKATALIPQPGPGGQPRLTVQIMDGGLWVNMRNVSDVRRLPDDHDIIKGIAASRAGLVAPSSMDARRILEH